MILAGDLFEKGRISLDSSVKEVLEKSRPDLKDALADKGISRLPASSQTGVRLARVLYSRILDRIEEQNYDVFRTRARTSSLEKVVVASTIWVKGRR